MADQRVRARGRDIAAVDLRAAGLTYQQIADQLGWKGRDGAYRAVERALNRQEFESATNLRRLEGARLDALQRGLWTNAVGGDVVAVGVVLRIMERRAKLLCLDAPPELDMTDVIRELARDLNIDEQELMEAGDQVVRAAERVETRQRSSL